MLDIFPGWKKQAYFSLKFTITYDALIPVPQRDLGSAADLDPSFWLTAYVSVSHWHFYLRNASVHSRYSASCYTFVLHMPSLISPIPNSFPTSQWVLNIYYLKPQIAEGAPSASHNKDSCNIRPPLFITTPHLQHRISKSRSP